MESTTAKLMDVPPESGASSGDKGLKTGALARMGLERKARVVVVGTYGESPLKGALLGSTPHKLLAISEVPVLVVPA